MWLTRRRFLLDHCFNQLVVLSSRSLLGFVLLVSYGITVTCAACKLLGFSRHSTFALRSKKQIAGSLFRDC